MLLLKKLLIKKKIENNMLPFYDENRTLHLNGTIDNESSCEIIKQLLKLEKENSQKDIFFFINSGGGNIIDGLSIIDVMNYISPNVNTIAIGQAASMAAIVLSCGEKNKRYSFAHSEIMIHAGTYSAYGNLDDIDITIKRALNLELISDMCLSKATGKTLKQIQKDCKKDYYMSADQAKDYGIVDHVLINREIKHIIDKKGDIIF